MQLNSNIAAVVTGGASGLGAATARRLASHGVKVAIFDMNESVGQALASELGGVYCNVDVTSEEQVDAAFAKARTAVGQERILVNCAGTADAVKTASRDKKTGEIRHSPVDRFNRIIQINLVGTFRCIAKSVAGMLTLEPLADGDRGVIVNTASAAAQDGQVGQASYSASKAAIVGMTLPIARDLMDEGIRVNTILPGLFGTPLLQSLPDNVKQALAASVPFPKRLGEPEEYAHAVEFLATCGYMNAESIRLDGAIRMAPR
ncbi:SDR family NAD(P)-dependent oxidoreductase [Ralstonia flatus]|uniref:Oxidoreductase n=1 Tax=Ralstonia flatus TaxID=3058601 RepID=A0ABM9L0N1_9RALS|nr:SDR family NAD(P)-dependent oxidoreductase [Ralstonia sp. LMG 32965]CAJ0895756.1 putative oxidoreductase [Ralstonia sp. LMG 32965]